MVLESIVSPLKAESHPRVMLIHGFIYATLGLFLGMWIFDTHASLVMVFLTTMAAAPLIYNIIKVEEKKDLTDLSEKSLLKEHARAIAVFINYFIGATVAFAFWFIIFSPQSANQLFSVQTQTITQLRSNVTGNAFATFKVFLDILSNNLKVLIFCILFSFLYGLGAIFILTWNASVIGAAIGQTITQGLREIGSGLSIGTSHLYAGTVLYGLLRYAVHGIPEILAYFIAGLAGGIISIATIRHDFGTKKYEKIILDSSLLLLLSVAVIIIAAFLEVYITPLIF